MRSQTHHVSKAPALKLKLPSRMRQKFPKRPSAYQIILPKQRHRSGSAVPRPKHQHLCLLIHHNSTFPVADDISSKKHVKARRQDIVGIHTRAHTHTHTHTSADTGSHCTGEMLLKSRGKARINRALRAPRPATRKNAPASGKPQVPCVQRGPNLTWLSEFSVR